MSDATPSPTFVVGTAGHIDHGKSTLVKALTGTDPDRLAEEKARGMTIDLGFAWLRSPNGGSISIVDVPGHERFIKNMLAGVGGIDAALLVIAADEGPMPQTDEHLAILDLLGVSCGLVAISKRDLVDQDWLDLVTEETRERLAGSVLETAPIVPCSAMTGDGLPLLLAELDRILADVPTPASRNRPRLPIDRVFTISGFGTVVTGTLTGGELHAGQEIIVFPRRQTSRIRSLQSHGRKSDRALPGSRVAVNVAGLSVDDLRRGDVITVPGILKTTQRIDVRLRLIAQSPIALEQNDQVDFFVGAAELPAWVTLLDRERLDPGDTGWVQVRFRDPVAVLKGDRFIIRRPSPSLTIGGGEVVDPTPIRHRRFRPDVLGALETLASGSHDELVLQALDAGPAEFKSIMASLSSSLNDVQVTEALRQLILEGDALNLSRGTDADFKPGDFIVATRSMNELRARISSVLEAFHRVHPLRKGMQKEELRSRLHLIGPPRLFEALIRAFENQGVVIDDGATLRLSDFTIVLDPVRRTLADRYLAALRTAPYTPPSPIEHGLDGETVGALVDLGELIKVTEGVVYDPVSFDEIERRVIQLLDRDGVLTLAGFRDHFQTSRKYAQATLEYLDQRRITRRVGDERVRYTGPGAGQPVGGAK